MATALAEIASPRNAGEHPPLKVNSVVRNLETLAKRAFRERWIVAYSSRTGLGKSIAVDYLAATLPLPKRVIRCKQTTSLKALLEAIALDANERRSKSHRAEPNAHQLYEFAIERARREPFLLLIDEADRLATPCFECVRDWWDDVRLGVLLVGNEDLETIIHHRHERLARRIRLRFNQADLKAEATREVLEFMGFDFTDEEGKTLWEACGGSPGWWEAVLTTRNTLAESHGVKPTIEHLVGALKYFPTLGRKL